MNSAITAFAAALLATAAWANDPASAVSDETPATDQTADKVESEQAATAATDEEFKPPPGFKRKKFGDKTLYCMKDTDIGTRFKTEKCLDEAQMRDYVLAQEQNNRDFDRVRAICSNPAICAPP
jgi:hypothetical protein